MRLLPKGNASAYLIAVLIGIAVIIMGVKGLAPGKNTILILFGVVMIVGGAMGFVRKLQESKQAPDTPPEDDTKGKGDTK